MKALRVAMLAPPWLPIPPIGYGGIENVLQALIPELLKLGVEVELFATGNTTIPATKHHALYADGQYQHIHEPQYESMPITIGHLLYALNVIRKSGDFDIIHDHNGFLGPLALANTQDNIPPAIHTLHGPPFTTASRLDQTSLPDNLPMWRELATANKLYLVGISNAMTREAPKEIKHLVLPSIHNAIDVSQFPFVAKKKDYFITLARFHPEKGQHIAVQIAMELGYTLKMAGVVGDLTTHRKVMLEIANPLSPYRSVSDFRYYSDFIFPHLLTGSIEHVGEVSGQRKMDFISNAKALLFPIQWEEPFGMAVIEALACGTPVVAMDRGAMPEIIKHGYNGFLAHNIDEFKAYTARVHEIDPGNCRKSVEEKFSARHMAERYIEHYKTIISKYKNLKSKRS